MNAASSPLRFRLARPEHAVLALVSAILLTWTACAERSTSPDHGYTAFLSLNASFAGDRNLQVAASVDAWRVDVTRPGAGVIASASGSVAPDQQSVQVPGIQVPLDEECETLAIRVELLSAGEPWWVAIGDHQVCVGDGNSVEVPALEFQWSGPEPPSVLPATLEFALAQGAVSSQAFTISPTGDGTTSWTAGIEEPGVGWLTLEPGSGTVAGEPAVVEVRVSAAGLEPGSYAATIVVEGFPGPRPRVDVTMTVLAGPLIGLAPASFAFQADQGQAPPSQTFTVTHAGEAGTLAWSAAADREWLQLEPASGSLAAGQSRQVTASVASQALADGDYTGTITVSAPAALNSPQSLPVGLTVNEVFASSISGSVGADGDGLAGVTVTLDGPDGAQTTTTGSDGAYAFTGLPDGSYTVGISGYPADVSFESTSRTVSLGVGDNQTVSFPGSRALYTLTVDKSGQGTVSSNPAGISIPTTGTSDTGTFTSGTSVTLTATPAAGWRIAGWGGACGGVAAGATQCTVAMTGNRTASVTMERIVYTLSVSKTGQGTVTSSPAGISIGTTGTSDAATFPSGTSVTLTADPASGWMITTWGGACGNVASGSSQCTVSMTANRSASVTMVAVPRDLAVRWPAIEVGSYVWLSAWLTDLSGGDALDLDFQMEYALAEEPHPSAAVHSYSSQLAVTGPDQEGWYQDVLTDRCVPASLALGPYFAVVSIDPDDTIAESDETNNWAATEGATYIQKDLAAGTVTVSPASPTTADPITIRAVVHYAGTCFTGTVPWRIHIDGVTVQTGTLSWSDLQDGTDSITVQAGPIGNPEQHVAVLELDQGGIVPEDDETNNVGYQYFDVSFADATPTLTNMRAQLVNLNDDYFCGHQDPPGSHYRFLADYDDANGDVTPGEALLVDETFFAGYPSQTLRITLPGTDPGTNLNYTLTGDGYAGTITLTNACIVFAGTSSVTHRWTLYDAAGLESETVSVTVQRPATANSIQDSAGAASTGGGQPPEQRE